MKFPRNIFYPIRLILYPILIQFLALMNGAYFMIYVWIIADAIGVLLLMEAIWEFMHPYADLNGTELILNSSFVSKRKIDLAKYTEADLHFHDWHVQIGDEYVSLRKIRAGYRERFEEAIELYFKVETKEA